MDRLGKTDAQVARERDEEKQGKAKVNECQDCYWEARSAGCAPYCRRGYQYGSRCREYRQS